MTREELDGIKTGIISRYKRAVLEAWACDELTLNNGYYDRFRYISGLKRGKAMAYAQVLMLYCDMSSSEYEETLVTAEHEASKALTENLEGYLGLFELAGYNGKEEYEKFKKEIHDLDGSSEDDWLTF